MDCCSRRDSMETVISKALVHSESLSGASTLAFLR